MSKSQIFGDGTGRVVALGERDCSLQRRNQKVIEEALAPNLPEHVRVALTEAAVRLGAAARYRSAGTRSSSSTTRSGRTGSSSRSTRASSVEHGVPRR